jgi:hypothetical protein
MATAMFISTVGCNDAASDGSSDAPVAGPVERAAEDTRATRTARLAISMTIRDPYRPTDQMSLRGDGSINFATGDYSFKVSDGRSGSQIEARQVGGVTYVRVPPEGRSGLPAGKEWIRTGDPTDSGQFPGTPEIQRIIERSPADTLRYLQALNADVTRIGRDRVAGDELTVYRSAVDLDELVTKQLASTQDVAELRNIVGSNRLVTTVWVSREGLVRQTRTTLRPSITACGETVRLEVSETDRFSDFGADVPIEPPDRSAVIADTDPLVAQSGELC